MKSAILFMLLLACSASPAVLSREAAAENPPAQDFHGREFAVLTPTDAGNLALVPDEMTGEAANDAAYFTLLRMEDACNTRVRLYKSDDAARMLKNSVLAADPAFDIALLHSTDSLSMGAQGMLIDLAADAGLRLDAPWWNGSDELSIGGVCYSARAPFTAAAFENAYVLRLNDASLASDIFRKISRGKWTLDEMERMMLESSRGIDADGDEILSGTILLWGVGESMLVRSEDGLPILNQSMALYDAVDRIAEIFAQSQTFSEADALFTVTKFGDLDGAPFVLLPKLDEDAEGYVTPVAASTLTLAMPVTNLYTVESATFTDAWAQLYWRDVLPEYMASEAMKRGDNHVILYKSTLEWMEPGLTISLGEAADLTRDLERKVSESITSGAPSLASNQARYRQLVEKRIEKLVSGWLFEI